MKHAVRILVTAVGSELALSIIKACRLSRLPIDLVGCDMQEEVVGRFWCDTFVVCPAARNESVYMAALLEIIQSNKIQILVPTSDVEIPIIAKF